MKNNMSLKDKLNSINVSVKPRCATCGCDDQFEYNEDFSYIKCKNCGREYFGGKTELLEYNTEAIEEAQQELMNELAPIIREEIINSLNKKR